MNDTSIKFEAHHRSQHQVLVLNSLDVSNRQQELHAESPGYRRFMHFLTNVSLMILSLWLSQATSRAASPSATDLFDVSQGVAIDGSSGYLWAGYSYGMFGGTSGWAEPDHTLFAD